MRYLFHYLPTLPALPTTLVIGWIETDRDRQRQAQTQIETERNRETETEKPIPKVEIQPHTLFTHVFSPFFCFFGNVRNKDER